jgi:integrase
MADKIDTVTARDKLAPRHAPYWHKIKTDCHLGYRKITADSRGAWLARYRDTSTGKYQVKSMGALENVTGARRFDEASEQAKHWFDHRSGGGATEAITVGQACDRYVKKLEADGRDNTAQDAAGRFKRWIYPDKRLTNTPLLKLSAGQLTDWRTKLVKAPVIPQDKTQKPSGTRSLGTVNRDMTAFKAALNLALEDGYTSSATAWENKLRPTKDADGRRDVYLDIAQRRALIAEAPDDLAGLLRALSLVPLRPGAMAGLRAGDYDRRLGVLRIGKDKSGKDRKITLPPATAAFFAEHAKSKLPTAPLIARADGRAWDKDAWKGPFKTAALAAGLPPEATAYALRHSTITDLIALHRLDTLTVAQLAGTSLAMIEKHYGHLLAEHATKALSALVL